MVLMSFLKGMFSGLGHSNSNDDFEDQFEFHYTYNKKGSSFDTGKEEYFDYEVNVTVEFLWELDKNMYEVAYYVSSDTVADVDVPNDDEFINDVYKDLKSKGVKLDYIPHHFEWNMY